MFGLADTHCHLDFELFNEDREEVLERAFGAGVDRILVPGIDLASSKAAVALADRYPQVYAAVGIHPNETTALDGRALEELAELGSHPKVVAVGEIGLDYYRDRAPRSLQQQIFRQQLILAAGLELPVIIHNRQAAEDLLAALADWHTGLRETGSPLFERPGVLHSFSESTAIAERAIGINFKIGITGPVTFRNAPGLRETVAELSLAHILTETDAPFLTPHPHRGERNEPAFVRFVAEKISEIHSLSLEEVAAQTSSNANRLFNWREID